MMSTAFSRGILLSLLFALCFSVVSCDSGGSSESGPEWVGTWEVEDFGDEGGAPNDPNYWDLSEGTMEIIEDFETGCDLAIFEVTSREGSVITLSGSTPNSDGQTLELSLEVSGETMTATILENTENPELEGNEILLSEIGGIPVDTGDCNTSDF